jgi:SAM-dependent methyltransferase
MQAMAGTQPLSHSGGRDRGTPINRYYLQHFFQEVKADIAGHCLEFGTDWYASLYGKNSVTKLDDINKEEGNENATIVADLTQPNDIPSDIFDCIICTYVLHMIFEVEKAVADMYRILKPGGVLLVAVPNISRSWPEYHELWRITPEGLHLLLARVFGPRNVTVWTYGNSLTAAGVIRGLAAEEFTKAELDGHHDVDFAVGVFARASKLEKTD